MRPRQVLPWSGPWRVSHGGDRRRVFTQAVLRILVLATTGGLAACGSDSPLAPNTAGLDLETGFWHLTLNHQAVPLWTVAPYDTVRLVATPRNAVGEPLAGPVLDSVATTYVLQDPSDTSLTITADGVVRARYAHDGSVVIVRTQVRGLTRVDSIPVNVTAEATPLRAAALALSVTPDTLTGTLSGTTLAEVTARVLDGDRQEVLHAAVRFIVDTTRLTVFVSIGEGTGQLGAQDSGPWGQTWVVAEATVYGVTVRDSVSVTATPPAVVFLTAVFGTPKAVGHLVGHFEPAVDTMTLATAIDFAGDGGTLVIFQNSTATPIDVVFDDPAAVSGSLLEGVVCGVVPTGNIPAFRLDPASACAYNQAGYQLRVFTTPGTYHYHSALYGTAGTIVVVPR